MGEFGRDPDSLRVYRTQMRCLSHVHESMSRGIAVNKARVIEGATLYQGKMDVAEKIARAYCGWPINLNSDEQLKVVLYEQEGLPVQKHRESRKPTTDADAIAALRGRFLAFDPEEDPSPETTLARISDGAHPLIESRVLYANAEQCISHYITPLVVRDASGAVSGIRDRVHHTISLHSQKNARWSYTDPPLAQLPDDLEDLYEPDPDWPWFGFDWDQIELIEVAAECKDPTLLNALRNGWDVHTMSTVAMFALPAPPTYKDPHFSAECAAWREQVRWQGKTDPRRVYCKRRNHRKSYGGTARKAGSIPGTRTLGITPALSIQMDHRYEALFPGLAVWQREFVAEAMKRGETRTWYGRRRRYLAKKGTYKKGEMLDHPMQGGVQEIAMLTFLEIKDTHGPRTYFAYGKHDSQWWAIHRSQWGITEDIKRIVTQPRNIRGEMIPFPATFKSRGYEEASNVAA